MIREIVAVGIGGALGSMSRYLVSYVWLAEQSLLGFPAGTFTVNAAGSLLMGFLLEMLGAGTASWLLLHPVGRRIGTVAETLTTNKETTK